MAGNGEQGASKDSDSPVVAVSEKGSGRKSVFRRLISTISLLGHLIFRSSNNDFEKRLKHLSKEEAAVHTRLKRRSQTWRKLARAIILYSIILELLFLGIAIITTRSPELTWQIRAARVLPIFAFPAFATVLYSTCASYYRMREHKDQNILDRVRAERQEKIDELKERTNYYLTQQLIQQYDTDPAAKAAAASVLASKLGAESGLKIALQSLNQTVTETNLNQDKHIETTVAASRGVRRRKGHQRTQSATEIRLPEIDQGQESSEITETGGDVWVQGVEVEHYKGKGTDGGWIARLAAMLVGEDPTQCYALICGKCHMHNGLAKKEDFPYITYYCPHCHALNGSKQVSNDANEGVDTVSQRKVDGIDTPVEIANMNDASMHTTNLVVAHGALKGDCVPKGD